jgi:hypothetical protein
MLKHVAAGVFLGIFVLCFVSGCSGGKSPALGERDKDQSRERQKSPSETAERPTGKGPKMDPYLEAVFAGPDDYELIHCVFKRITQKCDGSSARQLAALPESQRVVLHVCGTQGIVDNGSFQALFAKEVADFRGMADAFDAIGVPTAISAVHKALAIFPGSRPQATGDQRVAYLKDLGKTGEEKLDEYTREFWDAHRQILLRTGLYIRSHRDSFASLPAAPGENMAELKTKNLPPPNPEAYSRDAARWLESIDAKILVDAPDVKSAPFWVTADLDDALRGDARIVGLQLEPYRTSTDKELQTAAKLEALAEVNEIVLGDTYVSEAGLGCLKQFRNLRTLSLRRTDVTDSSLRLLQGLSLEELNLARTQVTDIGLEYVARIPSLRFLELYRTQISGNLAAALKKLPNLEVLSIGNTDIDDDSLDGLESMRRMRSLDLQYSKITDEALRHVQNIISLEELNLTGTRAGDLGMTCLKHLAMLKSLRLDETQISNEGLAPVGNLAGLQELSVSYTEIDDAGMASLRGLRKLDRLNLRSTSVGDQGLAYLASLRELSELDLRATRVTDAGLSQLFGLAKLTSILIDSPGVTTAGLARLRNALPKAEIQR